MTELRLVAQKKRFFHSLVSKLRRHKRVHQDLLLTLHFAQWNMHTRMLSNQHNVLLLQQHYYQKHQKHRKKVAGYLQFLKLSSWQSMNPRISQWVRLFQETYWVTYRYHKAFYLQLLKKTLISLIKSNEIKHSVMSSQELFHLVLQILLSMA